MKRAKMVSKHLSPLLESIALCAKRLIFPRFAQRDSALLPSNIVDGCAHAVKHCKAFRVSMFRGTPGRTRTDDLVFW
jgi:hypothetical protein